MDKLRISQDLIRHSLSYYFLPRINEFGRLEHHSSHTCREFFNSQAWNYLSRNSEDGVKDFRPGLRITNGSIYLAGQEKSPEELQRIVKLLDIFVGNAGMVVAPKAVRTRAKICKAGDFAIGSDGKAKVLIYLGIAPQIYGWHPVVTSMFNGAARTALAISAGGPRYYQPFLEDEDFLKLVQFAINTKNKAASLGAFELTRRIISERFTGSVACVFSRSADFRYANCIGRGEIHAHASSSYQNWSRIRSYYQYPLQGFRKYVSWRGRRNQFWQPGQYDEVVVDENQFNALTRALNFYVTPTPAVGTMAAVV